MTKLFLIFFTVVLSLFTTKAGHIFSQPSEIIPQNHKYATDIHLFFSLETALVQGDYIYIKFPFSIGIASATISVNLDVGGSSAMKLTRSSGNDPEHYFLLPSALNAGSWYRLQLKVADTSLGSQTPGPQGCVNFQTSSSDGDSRIIYDMNTCLDYISLGPAVDTTIFKVYGSYTYTQATVTKNFGQTYTAFFDIFPNIEVEQGAIIQLLIANSAFSFGSSCASIDCLIGSTNPDCPVTYTYNMTQMLGSCISNGQSLTFTLNQRVTLNPFRIQAMIVNPNGVYSSAVTAIYKSKKAETWFATTTVQASSLNSLALITSYPIISATATVSLFWGLQSQAAGGNGYGCPITIYKVADLSLASLPARTPLLKILNSMQSSVSITTTINSFKDLTYLTIFWYPVEVTSSTAVLTVLLSSIQSNFPIVSGTRSLINYQNSQNAISVTNIDTLSQGTNYKISGKFVITGSATSASCGKVEFYKGNDLSSKLGTSSSVTIPLKWNIEKIDSLNADAPAHTTMLAKFSYNIFHSYLRSSTMDLGFVSRTTNVAISEQTRVFNLVKENFYTSAITIPATPSISKPGVYIRLSSSTDSDDYGLFVLISVNSDADICQPISAGLTAGTTTCFKASSSEAVVVMLKIVFNNKVLGISDNDFPSGVVIVGTLFAYPIGLVAGAIIDSTITGGGISDYGSKNADKVNFISYTENYWHVTVICKPSSVVSGASQVTACNYIKKVNSATNDLAGISFRKTKIAFYPSQYVDTYVFDFLICFKTKVYGTTGFNSLTSTESEFKLVDGTEQMSDDAGTDLLTSTKWDSSIYVPTSGTAGKATSGPSMYNAYVIQGPVYLYKSFASFVNYYTDATTTYGSGNYFASYLRVHAIFGVSDLSSAVSQISIFLDGNLATASTTTDHTYTSLKKYASPEGDVNLVDHTAGTQVTGTIFQGYDDGAVQDTRYHDDLWFMKSGFKYSTSLSSSNAEVNVYIPIKTNLLKLDSLHVVAFGANNIQTNVTPLIGVFRVFGSAYKNVKKTPFPITSNSNVGNGATPAILKGFPEDVSSWGSNYFWSADTILSTGTGCALEGETSRCIIKSTSSSATEILPSKTYTSTIAFYAELPPFTVASATRPKCGVSAGNDLVKDYVEATDFQEATATPLRLGSAFIVYSRDIYNIFSAGTLSWSISNNINKCIYHSIPFAPSSVSTTYYTILCQTDKSSSANYGTSSTLLTMGTFTVPFYWGYPYPIAEKLQYVWSGNFIGTGAVAGAGGQGVFVGKDVASTETWILKTCLISANTGIAKDTRDVSYTLALSNNVNYILEPTGVTGDSLVVTESFLGGSVTSINTALCEFPNNALLSCSLSGVSQYTLKNLDNKKLTISSININVIIDTVGTTNVNHYAEISYKGITIESCSKITPLAFSVDASQGLSVISFGSTSDFKYTNMKGARGAFYFTFTFSRIIRKGNVFVFNLGFFANPTSLTKNFRCIILSSNGAVSNNFASITTNDLTASTVLVKTSIITGGSFRYKCMGGQTTDYTSSINVPISAIYGRSGLSSTSPIATTETKITPGLIPPDSTSINQVSLTKLFKTKGFDADYIISFLPSSTNITSSGRIIVEFTRSISPKLNYAGVLSCYLNEVPAFCEFVEERRVSVWPNIVLYKTNPTPYVLRISGVTQPNAGDVDNNPLLYLALDTNDNVFDTIAEQIYINDIFDTSLNLPGIIYVHDFSYSQNKIRSTTSMSIVVNLPANSVFNNNFVYVQLPASLDASLFYSPTVTCSIRRVGDSSLADFVKTCNLVRGRKVIIHLNTDSLNNVNLNYTITLSNILTPQQPSAISTWFREDVRVFIAPDNQTVTYTSAPGNRNTTTYMNWIVDSNVLLLNWLNTANYGFSGFQNFIDIAIGHYISNPAIMVSNGNFNNTFTWQFTGANASSFTSQQNPAFSNSLQIRTGFSSSKFFIGAKENVAPSKYYLSTIKNGDTYNAYSPLPCLDIRVVQTTCYITPSLASLTIPAGGYSNPIVLNFQNCIPMTDVTVLANITTGTNLFLSFANGQSTHSQGLKFDSILGNYQIYFYLYSANPNNNLTSGAATVSFTLSGTDAPFFGITTGITVNIIAPSADLPVPQTPTVIANPGNTFLSFSCSQTGNIYYALGIKSSVNNIKVDKIKNITENSLVRQTVPDMNDAEYKIYGYIPYTQSNVYQQIVVSNSLKAGENYTVIAYCMNQIYVVGNLSASNSWIQPDNQGKTVAIKFIFKNGQLSQSQKLDLACGLARFFAIPPSRVKTDEGFSCPSLRILQTTTANSSINTTVYSPYNFFIVKDYFTTSDSLYQDVQSKMRDTTFASQVLKLTSNGVTGFPVVNATSNQIIDAYTIQGSVIPSVTAGAETTNWNSVAVPLTLKNVQGYVFAAIANQSAPLPTAQQIRLGVDGSGTPLIQRSYSELGNNTDFLFNFTSLQNTTNYTLFWFGSNLDTSINSVVSPVGQRAVATTSVWQYGGLIGYSFVLIMMVVVLIMNLA